MTDQDYTHVAIIADRSGSMSEWSDPPRTKAQDATEGVRSFVTTQRTRPGKITFSLSHFNTIVTDVTAFSDGADLLPSEKLEVGGWECEPYGGTALLDAIGKIITSTGKALEALPEDTRPGKVIVLIWTDGEENSSKKYGREQVAAMIARQRDTYGWTFVYMGVGEDAYLAAPELGFSDSEAVFVAAFATADSYDATNVAVSEYRSGAASSVSYSPAVRKTLSGE